MERAVATTDIEQPPAEVKIPRPRPGGTYTVESMGRFVDRLMGERSIQRAAAEHLEPLYAEDQSSEGEPEPVEIPEPRPGATENVP